MPPTLSVIIVSYNVRYYLEQCLRSVRRAGMGLHLEVVVVDNASSDGSLEYLRPLFPEVAFIASPVNLGFSRACNLGFRHTSGSNILFLNPDVLLGEDTLHTCIRFLNSHAQAGAVGVRMIDGKGRFLRESKRGFPSPLTSLFKLTGMASLFPRSRTFSRYYLGHLSEHQNHAVEVLAGAFMMMPRRVLEKTGLFDEAFFMYGEDIDLSYRIRQAGYQNYYLADTTIIHFKGESTRRASLQHVRLFYQAMSIFVRKHYRGSQAGVFYVLLQIAIWLRATLAAAVRLMGWVHHLAAATLRQQPQHALPVAIFAAPAVYEQLSHNCRSLGLRTVPLRNLAEASALEQGQELLLCTSRNTMKEYIRWMQQRNPGFRYRFYFPGSGCIIGSSVCHTAADAGALHPTVKAAAGPLYLVN